ncbi:MAG: nuclear transport factor 2 family protein [Rhizobiaceae bacterium]|nr:nuclear transport factor 2 family protein [Rhizobiaceae bacterium]
MGEHQLTEQHVAAEIRAVVDGVYSATRQHDAANAMSFYAADATIYSLAPPLRQSNGDAAGLQKWMDEWSGPIELSDRDFEVTASGDTAFATSLTRLSGSKPEVGDIELWYRKTTGFRNIDGAWKIVHEHESVPFFMDGSNLAALDLMP